MTVAIFQTWFVMAWAVLRGTGQVFVDCLSRGICLMFSSDLHQNHALGGEDPRGEVAFLSHHLKDVYCLADLSLPLSAPITGRRSYVPGRSPAWSPAPTLFCAVFFRRKSVSAATAKAWEFCSASLDVEYLLKWFAVLVHKRLVFFLLIHSFFCPFSLFIQLFICISEDSWIFIWYLGLWPQTPLLISLL